MRQTTPLALAAAALIGVGSLFLALPASAGQGCPPGLQKKHNGCLPPGQAKKQYQYRENEHHRWRRGDVVRTYPYVVVRDYDRYHLPRLRDGSVYVAVGGQLLRVDPDTLKVIGIVGLVSDLLK